MTNEMIDTKQIDEYFIAANEAAEKSSKMVRGAVIEAIESGQQLNNAKEIVPHGQWSTYLGKFWNYTQKTACQYMMLASNFTCGLNLKDAKSINDALRMIADDKAESEPATAPRSERKPANVVVTTPADDSTRVLDDDGDPDADQVDDDPAPALPTQRKTAKGSEKVSEDKKPRTSPITPEILPNEPKETFPEEKTLSDWCEHEILEYLVKTADDAKRRAKALRKAADKLDPPTKFRPPDIDEVTAFFAEQKAADPESFFDFYESKGWLVGKVSMKSWQASARKWIRENDTGTKGRNNASRNNGKRGYTADEVFS